MEIKRRRFQGVLNILSFNRHFYFIGIGALIFVAISNMLFGGPAILYWITTAAILYGLMVPLLVSAYVYDFSGYYKFDWLKAFLIEDYASNQFVNINAGFDETSFIIKKDFPKSDLKVFDFYNAKQHTEPAIVRARKVSLVYPTTQQITSSAIPLIDGSADIIFLLSAAHEIRSFNEKVHFLKECHRISQPNGKIIMVEHLRDFPNFLAFTFGFTHFFSRFVWKSAFQEAGFKSFEETKFTPFMSIFYISH